MSDESFWWAIGINIFIMVCYIIKHEESPPLWLTIISFLVCYTAVSVSELYNTLAKMLILLAK